MMSALLAHTSILRAADTSSEVTIERYDETWVVEGPWLQRLIANVNFSDYESRSWFDKILRPSGLFDKASSPARADSSIFWRGRSGPKAARGLFA